MQKGKIVAHLQELPGRVLADGRATYRGTFPFVLICSFTSCYFAVVKIISKPLASSFLMYESGHYGAAKHKITVLKAYFFAYLSFTHCVYAGVLQQNAARVPFRDLGAFISYICSCVFVLFGVGGI